MSKAPTVGYRIRVVYSRKEKESAIVHCNICNAYLVNVIGVLEDTIVECRGCKVQEPRQNSYRLYLLNPKKYTIIKI
jgi:hypothetical protein